MSDAQRLYPTWIFGKGVSQIEHRCSDHYVWGLGGARDPHGVSSPLSPLLLGPSARAQCRQGLRAGLVLPKGHLAGARVYFPGKREGGSSHRVFGGVLSARIPPPPNQGWGFFTARVV